MHVEKRNEDKIGLAPHPPPPKKKEQKQKQTNKEIENEKGLARVQKVLMFLTL